MKKLIGFVFLGTMSLTSFSQGTLDPVRQAACKDMDATIATNIKNTENPKKSIKSATWVKLAESYVDHATACGLDSTATKKAYSTYLKAIEIEKAAGGKGVAAIEKDLKGDKLYTAAMSQGAAFYNASNMTAAGELFTLAMDIKPTDTTAALYAGIVGTQGKVNSLAKKGFMAYINNGGKDVVTFYSLANILKEENKIEEAIAMIKQGIAKNPNDKDLKGELINLYLKNDKIDDAIIDLEKLTSADSKNTPLLGNLGILYDNRAQGFASEIGKLKESIKKSDVRPLNEKLAQENEKLGIFDGEIAKLNAKLKKEPKTAADTKKRIAELNDQKRAINEKITSIKSQISNIPVVNTTEIDSKIAALTEKMMADKNKSMETYNKVLALDPSNFDVNFNIGVMYYNEAVEIKKQVDAMDMKTYQKEGKDVEKKVCDKFLQSKPYFEKCKSTNANDDLVNDNLATLERVLANCK
jgi:tetratricopeptide (TPR) repeat protein